MGYAEDPKGTDGRRHNKLEGRKYKENELINKTDIIATEGRDIYMGENEIENVTYEKVYKDKLTGLFITNSLNEITLISNNIPPLIADNYSNEYLVYKEKRRRTYDDIDMLREIDVIRASNNDDTAFIEEGLNTSINFLDGEDKVIIEGGSLQETVDKMENIEMVEWRKRRSNNGELEDAYILNVIKAEEDKENSIFINEELKELDKNTEDWYISYLDNTENKDAEVGEWINIEKVAASPEIIGREKITIYTQLKIDEDNEDEIWLEIHAKDLRENGKGLIGLDLDLSWNNESYIYEKNTEESDDIF